jgi:hypothetical protein
VSLSEWDDTEFDFLYISRFHVDDEYKNNSSDVAATALRQFLHHPFISGELDTKVSSVADVLDPCEAMSKEELDSFMKHKRDSREVEVAQMMGDAVPNKQQMDQEKERWDACLDIFARQDAIPILRNGIFQDPAIAMGGGSDARIIVASHHHFHAPLKSHTEAMAVQFCTPVVEPQSPRGKDGELFSYIRSACEEVGYDGHPTPNKLSQIRSKS